MSVAANLRKYTLGDREGFARGRDGIHRSTKTHIALNGKHGGGGLTAGEIQRRFDERADQRTLRVACVMDGCRWDGFTGPAGEARERGRAHRAEAHPETLLLKRRRARAAKNDEARASGVSAASVARRNEAA